MVRAHPRKFSENFFRGLAPSSSPSPRAREGKSSHVRSLLGRGGIPGCGLRTWCRCGAFNGSAPLRRSWEGKNNECAGGVSSYNDRVPDGGRRELPPPGRERQSTRRTRLVVMRRPVWQYVVLFAARWPPRARADGRSPGGRGLNSIGRRPRPRPRPVRDDQRGDSARVGRITTWPRRSRRATASGAAACIST